MIGFFIGKCEKCPNRSDSGIFFLKQKATPEGWLSASLFLLRIK